MVDNYFIVISIIFTDVSRFSAIVCRRSSNAEPSLRQFNNIFIIFTLSWLKIWAFSLSDEMAFGQRRTTNNNGSRVSPKRWQGGASGWMKFPDRLHGFDLKTLQMLDMSRRKWPHYMESHSNTIYYKYQKLSEFDVAIRHRRCARMT